jgi:hypothetical protein
MPKQLIFIDDSGDPGLPPKRMISRYFLLAGVFFGDSMDAELVSASLKILKRDMGWQQEHEFKFNNNNHVQKEKFFKAIRKYGFSVRVVVVDKMNYCPPTRKEADVFYNFMLRELLQDFPDVKNARVYIDGGGGKNYRRRSGSYLRQELNKTTTRIGEIKFVDSKTDVLVQLVDMIAGAVRRKYERGEDEFFKFIKSKIEGIEEYR